MVGMRVKNFFFDKPAVLRSVERTERRVLARAGAFVRRSAKKSIRKSRKTSLPGRPPRSHVGTLKKLIFFAFDPRTRSAVIGPMKFRRGEAPEALEHGGTTTVVRRRKGKWVRDRVRIAPRPFMGPALKENAPKVSEMWRNSVRAF